MSSNDTRAFIQRYFATLIDAENKAIEKLDDFVADPKLKQHALFFDAAFPAYQVIPDDIIVENDKACVRATFTGVHKGEFMGVPPTGRRVTVSCIIIYRIANDKIVETWYSIDRMTLLEQLGHTFTEQFV